MMACDCFQSSNLEFVCSATNKSDINNVSSAIFFVDLLTKENMGSLTKEFMKQKHSIIFSWYEWETKRKAKKKVQPERIHILLLTETV